MVCLLGQNIQFPMEITKEIAGRVNKILFVCLFFEPTYTRKSLAALVALGHLNVDCIY